MPETPKDSARDALTAERDALRREVENLRGQLAAAGANRVTAPQHTFMLSEGQRQELIVNGVIDVGGRRMTRDDVKKALGKNQEGVDLGDADPVDAGHLETERSAIRGFDYVYPSVAPGLIDPAVAGTPGINGPAAGADDVPAAATTGTK